METVHLAHFEIGTRYLDARVFCMRALALSVDMHNRRFCFHLIYILSICYFSLCIHTQDRIN